MNMMMHYSGLVDARLVHKIYRSSAPGLPVAAYDDLSAFKIYLVDVGLLRRLAKLAPTALVTKSFVHGVQRSINGEFCTSNFNYTI